MAKYSGSYKVYTDAAAGKPIYNRIVRIPGVAVSGTIDGAQLSGYKVMFKDEANGITYDADIKGIHLQLHLQQAVIIQQYYQE